MIEETVDSQIQGHEPSWLMPMVAADRCVHALSPVGSCRSCAQACPRSAWILDDDGLSLNTDACDRCGLCEPACPEGAIGFDAAVSTYVSPGPERRSAFGACDRAVAPAEAGRVGCVHAIGTRALARLYRLGVRALVVTSGECASCARQPETYLHEHIADLRRLLSDRGLADFSLRELEPAAWLAARADAGRISRRGIFQVAFRSQENRTDSANDVGKLAAVGEILPGAANARLAPFVPALDAKLCTACGVCAAVCPHDVIKLAGEAGNTPSYEFSATGCTGCGLCVDACDAGAVQIERWGNARSEPIPLVSNQCNSCGNRYYSTTSSAGSGRCRICSASQHNQNLFQVLA